MLTPRTKPTVKAGKKKVRKTTAAQRKAISKRMKATWARRKAGAG